MSDAEKLRKQVATLASFGGKALRSSEIGDLLQEATRLVSMPSRWIWSKFLSSFPMAAISLCVRA